MKYKPYYRGFKLVLAGWVLAGSVQDFKTDNWQTFCFAIGLAVLLIIPTKGIDS